MRFRSLALGLVVFLPVGGALLSQAPIFPVDPILQLDPGGPTAAVTCVAFSPKGDTLYAAGYDKVIRVWNRDAKTRKFVLGDPFRVPIGPGADGAINALAVSPDGRWLAAAGRGVVRELAGFRQSGIIQPRNGRMTKAMLLDQGAIHLFDTTAKAPSRILRGHLGPVLSMTFAPDSPGKPALLVSVGREPKEGREEQHTGVLRLWDAKGGEQLAQSDACPDPVDGRPGLALWHTGKGPKDLCAALACNGQPLQVWDATTSEPVPRGEKSLFNDTVAFVPNGRPYGGTLVASCFQEPGARLLAWEVSGKAKLVRLADDPPLLVKDGAPSAMALLPDGRGAVVVRMREKRAQPTNEYRLVIFGRSGPDAKALLDPVSLWRGKQKPALAASSDGMLAVAGNHGHEILVFASQPRAKGLRQIERLQAKGAFVQQVAFVRRGDDRGLMLVERAEKGAKAHPWFFDFAGRSLTDERKTKKGIWEKSSPAAAGWKVTPLVREGGTIGGYEVAGHADGEPVTVRLGANRVGTAYALLPPCKPLGVPLLAVGYLERGVAYLRLYEAKGGQQVRQFTGHLNTIRSLAFDADGRLLVSAAEDKTVCVWSLTDLGDTYKKRGMLWGIAVKQGKGGLRVAELDSSSLSTANGEAIDANKIARDELIEKMDGFPPQALSSPHAFYEALWQRAPGTKVFLQIGGRRVPLVVDQGIDERKPLFSLFAIAGPNPEWIAWNPNGPYDTGPGIEAEGHMGWHSNPRAPGLPVEFNNAAKYRIENRRPGIIQLLVAKGNLADAKRASEAERVPKPRLALSIDEIDPDLNEVDGRGYPVVQNGRLTLSADVYGVPLAKLAKIQWQFDGGERRDFDEDAGLRRTANLGGMKWTRGIHELRLIATTIEPTPVETFKTLLVHYMPAPPSIAFAPTWLKKTFGDPLPKRFAVKKPNLTIEATADAAKNLPEGEQVQVELRHDGKSVRVRGMAIRKEVILHPGINVLELSARNEKAETGLAFESTTKRLEVHYDVPLAPTTVTVETIDPAPDPKVSLPAPGKAVVVRVPSVRVRVQIRASQPLTSVSLDGKPLAAFVPDGKLTSFLLDETVELVPGERKLTFSAKTRDGKVVAQPLRLTYHPDLPRLEATENRSIIREAGTPLDFPLQLRLTDRKHAHPFEVSIRVNGAKEEIPAKLDEGGRLLSAVIRLRPGTNHLVVVMKSKYGERLEDVKVYYKRPPIVLPIAKPPSTKNPTTTLTFRVRTPKDLRLLGVSVKDQEVSKDRWSMTQDPKNPEVWTVVLKGLDLTIGNNRFDIGARNDDGVGLEPIVVIVDREEPEQKPEPARVEIVEPQADIAVSDPRCALVFRVLSASPPRVRVLRDGIPLPLPKPRKEGTALVYRIDVTDLQPGLHTLRVEVTNAAGALAKTPERVVNYVPTWSVRIRPTRLERVDKPGEFLKLTEVAPVGTMLLHGAVEWRQASDPTIGKLRRLRVWVNAFQLRDVELGPVEGNQRAFKIPLRLNREQNQVELQLPEFLKVESNKPTLVSVACAKPETKQRLHLLIVGPGQDQTKLSAAVLKAFLASNIRGKRFQTPAFDEGILYMPPAGANVSREEIESFLVQLKKKFRNSTDSTSNVLVVFFSGREAIEDKKLFLLTETSRKLGRIPSTAIDCGVVREILSDFAGAKLLLLDTQRKANAPVVFDLSDDGTSSYLGLYRYVWLGQKNAPEEARLVYALKDSLSRASVLKQHEIILAKWAEKLGKDASFQLSSPSGLKMLRMGKESKE